MVLKGQMLDKISFRLPFVYLQLHTKNKYRNNSLIQNCQSTTNSLIWLTRGQLQKEHTKKKSCVSNKKTIQLSSNRTEDSPQLSSNRIQDSLQLSTNRIQGSLQLSSMRIQDQTWWLKLRRQKKKIEDLPANKILLDGGYQTGPHFVKIRKIGEFVKVNYV